ncbi:MAG: hypothetical protein AAGI03_05110 [Pseudomonadota bacterium]
MAVSADKADFTTIAAKYHAWYISTADNMVLLMYSLAFAVYLVAAQSHSIRLLMQKYIRVLIALMIVGNTAICIGIYVMHSREVDLLEVMGQQNLNCFAERGLELRLILTAVNISIYSSVLYLIWAKTQPLAAERDT